MKENKEQIWKEILIKLRDIKILINDNYPDTFKEFNKLVKKYRRLTK